MANKKVTLQSIADALHISKVTVHKALTNKSGVGRELKQQILETAAAMGYTGKNGEENAPKKYLYLYPKRFFFASEPFYSVIYYHLEHLAQEQRFELKLLVISDDEYEEKVPAVLEEYHPAGIFIGGEIQRKNIHFLERFDLPTVFIDFFSNRYKGSYVFVDNLHGSYYLVKYLVEMGHRRIGFVGDPAFSDSNMDRYLGYQKALLRNDIPVERELMLFQHIDNLTDLAQIKLPEELPTAFFCCSDHAALRLYLKLQMMGLHIPDDVSLVSFDNTEVCLTLDPKLTSCGCRQSDFAVHALRLMRMMVEDKIEPPLYQSLHPTIYKRDSVKKLTV